MNFIDILFILIFFGVLAAGFFQGMIRLIVLIAALYLSVVLASLYYAPLGEFFVRRFGAERYIGQYTAFFLVLLVAFLFLAIAGLYTFRYWRLPGSLQYLDRIVGTVLGMFLGTLVIGIFATLLYNLMVIRGGRNIDLPLFRSIGDAVASSVMVRYFSTTLLPLAYNAVDPLLPEGADLLFLAS